MVNRIKNEKGVTLVELLAVVAILSIIIMAISTVQLQFLDTYKKVNDGSFQNDDLSFFVQFFTNQVRDAKDIDVDQLASPEQGTEKVTITKEDGTEVYFEFVKDQLKVNYNDGSNTTTLLEGIKYDNANKYSFEVNTVSDAGKDGVTLVVQLEGFNPIETKVYSIIGTKGF